MCPITEKPEIDHHTTKLIVGLIAVSLPLLTNFVSNGKINSISAAYFFDDASRNIFVGFLFAISAFLLSYNGRNYCELISSKVAAIATLGVAVFPCICKSLNVEVSNGIYSKIHGISALIMFLILAYFCYSFYRRATDKGHAEALLRAKIYAVSGLLILGSILVFVLDELLGNALSTKIDRLVFYCEAAGLIAFGISWLTASRTLPIITAASERCSVIPKSKTNLDK